MTPYLVPFSDAMHGEGNYRRVVAVTASQAGKTEAQLDVMGASVDQTPGPIIYVGPTQDFLRDQFEPRLMAMIDEAATLRDRMVNDKRSKVLLKRLAGSTIRLAHAGSSAALKSDPARLALVDEYDEMMGNIRGAGDPLGLVEARGETYADFRTGVTSTCSRGLVTVEACEKTGLEFWGVAEADDLESPIWGLWQAGTRHHWAWPCRECHEYFIPRFDRLRWPKNATPAQAKANAYVECPRCGGVHEDEHKAWLNERGAMVAPGQNVQLIDDKPIVTGDVEENSTYSIWTSGLCSPFVTFGQRAETWLTAKASGDHDRMQTARNAAFGECYSITGSGDVPEWDEVLEHRKPYKRGEIPDGAIRLVMAADVQKYGIWFLIRAFGARGTSWLVDWGYVHGATEDDDVWDSLDDVLMAPYGGWFVERCYIDSGFRPNKSDTGEEHAVYAWAQRHRGMVWPTKGRDVQNPPLRISRLDVSDKKRRGRKKRETELVWLSSDFFKGLVMARIRVEDGKPGAFYLPQDADEEYARQVVSEARIVTNGKPSWVRRSRENHLLDCEAMAAAAAYSLNVHRIPDASETGRRDDPEPETDTPSVEPETPDDDGETMVKPRARRVRTRRRMRGLGRRLNG